MKHRSSASLWRVITHTIPLIVCGMGAIGFPLQIGQTQSAPTPEKPKEPSPERPKRETPPQGNPLPLGNPQNSPAPPVKPGGRKPNMTGGQPDFGNFQEAPDNPREARPSKKPLPLFGYNFFEPARQFILARRAYYARFYDRPPVRRYLPYSYEDEESYLSPQRRSSRGTATERLKGTASRPRLDQPEDDLIYPSDEELTPEEEERLAEEERALRRRAMRRNAQIAAEEANLSPQEERERARNREGDANDPKQTEKDKTSAEQGTSTRIPRRTPYSQGAYALPYGGRQTFPTSPVDAFTEAADPLTQLFRSVTSSVPTTYQLSTGDKVTVRYQSPTLAAREFTNTVDSQGTLDLEGTGKVLVRGLTLEAAQTAIRNRLKTLYRNVEVSVLLKELRTLSVTISGEVFDPGTFVLPATATAYNLVQVAGGPTDDGSLRRIQVLRQGRVAGTLDFYQMLRGGKNGIQGDTTLQSGDSVYIPPRESRVTVTGEVRTPAIFELIEGENLADALRYAGGVKASGVAQSVQLNTVDPGRSRVLKSVDIKAPGTAAKFLIYDGDTVDVFSVRTTLVNRVTLEGAVEQPGDYALTAGMRIADLLEQARGPLSEAALNQAELYRWNTDNTTTLIPVDLEKALQRDATANLPLTRWDRLKVYTREEIAWTGYRKVEVRGAVQYPGTYRRSVNMRVTDLLRQVGGPTPDAYLERAILLHQRGDGTFAYDYIHIGEALKGNREQDRLIEDNDLLAIYRAGEAQFTPERVVSIRGAVVTPGVYPRGEGMRLSELVHLAGGFRPEAGGSVTVAHARKVIDAPNAALKQVTITFDSQGRCRPEEDRVLVDGDLVTVQGTGGFIDHVQVVTVRGWVNKPGPIVLANKQMRLSDVIREAGGLRPEAFPEGAAFLRDPSQLASPGQRDLAKAISELQNLLNDSEFKRELAKSDIARIQAGVQASQDNPLAIAGLGGGGSAPNPTAGVLATELSKRELVTKPRAFKEEELQPSGAIAVNLPAALRNPRSADDILLMDGDVVIVPEQPTTVQIIGAVLNPRGILYKPGADLNYYIQQAGGYAPDVALNNIVIIRANGGTIPAKKVKEIRPGDLVLVPTRTLAAKLETKRNALDTIFRSALNGALIFRLFGL